MSDQRPAPFAPPAEHHLPVVGPPLSTWPERTIGQLLRSRAERFGDKVALRFRGPHGRWQELSFNQLVERQRQLAVALKTLGVERGDRVLLVSPNSVQMLVCELALVSLGAVSTPVFPDYAPELLLHCLRDSGARVALCGSAVHQRRLASVAGGQLERLVVLEGEPLPGDSRVLSLEALEHLPAARGPMAEKRLFAEVDELAAEIRPDEPAFMLYTSGTTGRPKGVPLTHHNVLSQQAAVARVWPVGPDDVLLSYLPWHHCFGSLFERLLAFWNGAQLVLDDSRGRDLELLITNFREIKPTVYLSVPRVYQGLVARAESDERARKALLHPGLRFVFTAAAPLPDPIYRFFEQAGVPVHEGWGLTESSPCATLTSPGQPRTSGVVGWPLPGTEVRLEGLEKLGDTQVGEVLVRGPQVMAGYHNAPEASGRALTPDGFLRTGDLGEWTPHGLRIRGRLDGVFKLQNGEKVPSAEVEARLLAATPLLEQAVVLGAGQAHPTALCWLNQTACRRFAEQRGLWPETQADRRSERTPMPPPLGWLLRLPELRRAITEALQSANLLAQVHYERVRRVALVPETLQMETGELTPTLKVVRSVVAERHQALVDALQSGAAHPNVLEVQRGDSPLTDPFRNA